MKLQKCPYSALKYNQELLETQLTDFTETLFYLQHKIKILLKISDIIFLSLNLNVKSFKNRRDI